jgi:hypothetical protein
MFIHPSLASARVGWHDSASLLEKRNLAVQVRFGCAALIVPANPVLSLLEIR